MRTETAIFINSATARQVADDCVEWMADVSAATVHRRYERNCIKGYVVSLLFIDKTHATRRNLTEQDLEDYA